MGYGEQQTHIIGPWMQDYIVTAFAEIAGMNIPTASNNAIQMLRYMDNFISGVYTHGSDGFNPYNGAAYYLKNIDPITNTPITTWAQLAQVNSTDYPLDATSLPHSSYPSDVQGYAVNARTALADLITYTQSTNAIEAYGFITGQIALAWGHNPAGMAAAYQGFPSWDVMPRLPDGEYLQASQMQIDVSNNHSVTLSATNRDSLLSVVGTGTATLTGGTGGTDLLFGGAGPTTLIAGTGNDYLFAGNGATTFIDNNGNDYMKGGTGTDTFTFADVHPGHDTIVNFKPGTDLLRIASNLDGIHIASAAQLVSAASVVGGSTVLHFGPNHDVTVQGINAPSMLTGSIVVF